MVAKLKFCWSNYQEPNNLTNKSSFRYSGLVQRKTVGVTAADKKGFVVSLKKVKGQRKPAKMYNVIKMKQPGTRRPLKKLRNMLVKNNYRKDLTKVCTFFWSESFVT